MGKALNLTNQRFGKLVALYPTEKRDKNGSVFWHCKCDCGNECDVRACELKRGNVQSCGCRSNEFRKKISQNHMKDLTGQRFGKLIALYPTNKRSGESVVWHCKCDCGNECDVNGSFLIHGRTQSCGCIKSRGEEKIASLLKNNNIFFERQKTFETCRFSDTNALAYFDFYLPDYDIIIEYDGIQHFNYRENLKSWNNKDNYEETIKRDKIKNQWCLNNNKILIRIPYTYLDQITIEDLLNDSPFRVEVKE